MSDKARRFPVLNQQGGRPENRVAMPRWVPWGFVEAHKARIFRTHDQTLERLAQRGGLAPCEIVAAVEDRYPYADDTAEMVAKMEAYRDAWLEANR